MNTLGNRVFKGLRDRNSARVFADMEFRDCVFDNCSISITDEITKRSTVRNVRLISCTAKSCGIEPAIIENVLIDGLNTNGQLLQSWGSAFKNVTLKGPIDRLMLSPTVVPTDPDSPVNKAFARANAEYYSGVDWALDISQAEAKELDLRGIPARLIRRDPETQVVVKADKAIRNRFHKLDFGETPWYFGIKFMLERGEADVVLVAPKGSPKFKSLLASLNMLREAGIAEPE
jgi:hypothetical protein